MVMFRIGFYFVVVGESKLGEILILVLFVLVIFF